MARQKVNREEAVERQEDFSKKLDEVVQKADTEAKAERARAVVFDSANRDEEKEPDPRLPPLVSRVFAPKDWEKALDRFDEWRSLGERRTEEAFIRRAHELGPDVLMELYDCYFQVKAAREEWELQNDSLFGDMREQATQLLQDEKDRKIRSKAITEKDVDSKCAAIFQDEWTRQQMKRSRMEMVEARMKACIEVATVRCRHLDTMMGKLR